MADQILKLNDRITRLTAEISCCQDGMMILEAQQKINRIRLEILRLKEQAND